MQQLEDGGVSQVVLSHFSLLISLAGSQSFSQCFNEAMDITEGVVQRHRSNSQHAGLPHVTGDAPLLQLLEDSFDVNGEGERELAASLLRVRRRDDVDVRFVRLSWVLSVEVLNQILQVARQ